MISMKQGSVLLVLGLFLALGFIYIRYPILRDPNITFTHVIVAMSGCSNSSCAPKFETKGDNTTTTNIPILVKTSSPPVIGQSKLLDRWNKNVLVIQRTVKKKLHSTTMRPLQTESIQRTPKLNSCPKENNSWKFTCYVLCPKFSITQRYANRWQMHISCDEQRAGMLKIPAKGTLIVPTVPFNSSCLESVLDTFCKSENRVPSIVHYIWFNRRELGYYHFLSFVSVHRFLKPCMILIHGDYQPYGKYWDLLLQLVPNIIHVYRDPPASIYGNPINKVEHKSDVARLQALQLYGGFYIDTDEIILRPMDVLRNYTFTLSHELDSNLANGLIMSAKNAPFLSVWLNGYRKFHNNQWAYFSTILPYELSKKYPHFIHIENKTFVKPDYSQIPLFLKHNFNWSNNFAIHLYTRFYNGKTYNFHEIRHLNTTIGSVSRHVLLGSKELCLN